LRIVDFHNHIGTALDTAQTVEELTAGLDRDGVEKAVVFPINDVSRPSQYTAQHEEIARAVVRHPGRLAGFLRPKVADRRGTERELARFGEYGFEGVKLHPLSDSFKPEDARFVLEFAQMLGVPVIIHTEKEPGCRPSEWSGLFGAFPSVTFVLAHSARSIVEDAVEVALRHPNVMLDTSVQIWFNLRLASRSLGADRFLFASDTPYSHRPLDFVIVSHVWSGNELEMVMGGNALRVLRGKELK
jgi:predicted TIM-barrel fold metal-dependent hydrolase